MTETVRSWVPTRKWFALLVTDVASILASWLVTGDFNAPERAMAAAALVSLAATYATPNENTPAGVPRRKRGD
jgi:hypothetical protein